MIVFQYVGGGKLEGTCIQLNITGYFTNPNRQLIWLKQSHREGITD